MDSFATLLASYLTVHLPRTTGCSPNTTASYRDAFVLLLRFLSASRGTPPDKTTWSDFTVPVMKEFLTWMETERGCSISTRNHRLAVIKAFLRYTQSEAPELITIAAPIIAMKPKRAPQPRIAYLTTDAVKALLAEAKQSGGLRDTALLSLLYDTGARVQEIADLKIHDLRTDKPATATLTGKGRKTRTVPVTPQVAALVDQHIRSTVQASHDHVFANRAGQPIGRAGIAWILRRHANAVHAHQPDLMPATVTPHGLRHSKAMHLLENGVNLIYIRDLLGHASITTTEIYARANPEMKRAAIDAAAANIITDTLYDDQQRSSLLDWLKQIL